MRFRKRRNHNGGLPPLPFRKSLAEPGGRVSHNGNGDLLQLLACSFEQAAGIYNQAAVSKVTVTRPDTTAPLRLSLTIQNLGYRFEETIEGSLYVTEIGEGQPRAWARLDPQHDQAGRIVCWRERKLRGAGAPTLRTADGLSAEYLLNLMRRRLVRPEAAGQIEENPGQGSASK